MGKIYILYNPFAGNKENEGKIKKVKSYFSEKDICTLDVTSIKDYSDFFASLSSEDEVVLCGGDGTLNRFVNEIYDLNISNNIYYYASGSGNDFLRDMNMEVGCAPFLINDYISSLPKVTVNNKTYRFINGVGYGIDGYCCEVGDKQRKVSDKPVDYTSIAIKGLLFHYKPTNAEVTVDGKNYSFKKVWIAPTMFGTYYGGGMMPAPNQKRDNKDKTVSFSIVHNARKFRTLCVFPSIFTGKHISHTSVTKVISGKKVNVAFDRPVTLQIDGETIFNVSEYTVEAPEK